MMQANPSYSSIPTAAWVVGYVVVGGVVYWLLTKKAYAAPAAGYTAPATTPPAYGTPNPTPTPSPTPAAQKCPFPFDKAKLNLWLEANNLFGFFSASCPPPAGYLPLATAYPEINNVPPGISLVAICEDTGDFWFYAGPGSTPVKRDDLRANYCKSIGATAGHPASTFMV
jgi:hypothetical protein